MSNSTWCPHCGAPVSVEASNGDFPCLSCGFPIVSGQSDGEDAATAPAGGGIDPDLVDLEPVELESLGSDAWRDDLTKLDVGDVSDDPATPMAQLPAATRAPGPRDTKPPEKETRLVVPRLVAAIAAGGMLLAVVIGCALLAVIAFKMPGDNAGTGNVAGDSSTSTAVTAGMETASRPGRSGSATEVLADESSSGLPEIGEPEPPKPLVWLMREGILAELVDEGLKSKYGLYFRFSRLRDGRPTWLLTSQVESGGEPQGVRGLHFEQPNGLPLLEFEPQPWKTIRPTGSDANLVQAVDEDSIVRINTLKLPCVDGQHVWSDDGKFLYVLRARGEERDLLRIDAQTWRIDRMLPSTQINRLAWSSAGLVVAAPVKQTIGRNELFDKTGYVWTRLVPPRQAELNWSLATLDPVTLAVRRWWYLPGVREWSGSSKSPLMYARHWEEAASVVNLQTGELMSSSGYPRQINTRLTQLREIRYKHFMNPKITPDGKWLISHGVSGPAGSLNRFDLSRGLLEHVECLQDMFAPQQTHLDMADGYACVSGKSGVDILKISSLSEKVARIPLPARTGVAADPVKKTLYLCGLDSKDKRLKLRVLRDESDAEFILAENVDPPTDQQTNREPTSLPLAMSAAPSGQGALVFAERQAYFVEARTAGGREWSFLSKTTPALVRRSAQPSPASPGGAEAILERAAASTALLVLPSQRGFATAFCVDRAGYFVTNARLVDGAGQGGEVSLVLQAGRLGQQLVKSRVVRIDESSGLAVLKLIDRADVNVLELGDDSKLTVMRRLTAYGFPLANRDRVRSQSYPHVSGKAGNVTSLRQQDGQLELIQFDAPDLKNGDTGGPVLDAEGKVVGVVIVAIDEADLHFLIPVSKLKVLLHGIEFKPPKLARGKLNEPVQFEAHARPVWSPDHPVDLQLRLQAGDGPEQIHAMSKSADVHRANVVPVHDASTLSNGLATIDYAVVALRAGMEVARLSGRYKLPPAGSQIVPPALESRHVEVPLPSEVEDVAVGGRGRWLILRLAGSQELLIFDVSLARFVDRIPLDEPQPRFAAGLEKLVVVLPKARKVHRYDLASLSSEQVAPLGVDETVDLLSVGSGGTESALLAGRSSTGARRWYLLDLASLRTTPITISERPNINRVRAASDGKTFAAWSHQSDTSDLITIRVDANRARSYELPQRVLSFVQPGPNGQILYSNTWQSDFEGKDIANMPDVQGSVPAHHGDFYAARNATSGLNVALYRARDARPVATLSTIQDVFITANRADDLTIEQGVHLIPDARLIVTIPLKRNRLVLDAFDFEQLNQAVPLAGEGAPPPTSVDVAKDATVLVVLPSGKGFGSGFCIDPRGYFVTNHHVIEDLPDGQSVTLVTNSGEDSSRELNARVIRVDPASDLALLHAEGAQGLFALPLAVNHKLKAGSHVSALGFPFGDIVAVRGQMYPAISINRGRVESVTTKTMGKESIEFTAQVNPGNSGGPLLQGNKVVGVVFATAIGARKSYAIPVSKLQELIDRPDVDFQPPHLTRSNVGQPTRFAVKVTPVIEPTEPIDVELLLRTGPPEVSLKLVEKDGIHEGTTIPLSSEAPTLIDATFNFTDGFVTGVTSDRPVTVGGQQVRLSQIRSLKLDEPRSVAMTDGRQLSGEIEGLDALSMRVGPMYVTIDGGKATKATLSASSMQGIGYELVVKNGGREVARLTGQMDITGAAGRPADLHEAGMIGTSQIDVGGNVNTVAVGGSGRWLCMHLPQQRQIVILDVIPGKVTHRIDLTEDDVLLTAGLSKLVVINAFSNEVQRFDLASGQRELTATLPERSKVGLLACGSASTGPALIYWSTPPVGHSRFSWLDLKSLRIASMASPDLPQQDVTDLFASGDGRFFGLTSSGKATGIDITNSITKPDIREIRGTVPGPSAEFLYSGRTMALRTGRAVLGLPKAMLLRPAHHGRYFWGYDTVQSKTSRSVSGFVKVYAIGEMHPLIKVDVPTNTLDFVARSVHVIPRGKAIVTIGENGASVTLHRVDFDQAIAGSTYDHLYITSSPPTVVGKDGRLQYEIQAQGRNRPFRYKLEHGPPGMKLTDEGVLSWTVPKQFESAEVDVITAVLDANGAEEFHSFRIQVVK